MGVYKKVTGNPYLVISIAEMLTELGLEEDYFIDEGADGYAVLLSDGTVMKITTSVDEAAAALLLMEQSSPYFMQIHAVARFTEIHYAIIREDAQDLELPCISRQDMKNVFNKLNSEWVSRDVCVPTWKKWVAALPVPSSFKELLLHSWKSLECLEAIGIGAGDIGYDNMGLINDGYMVLRDLSGCVISEENRLKATTMGMKEVIRAIPVCVTMRM